MTTLAGADLVLDGPRRGRAVIVFRDVTEEHGATDATLLSTIPAICVVERDTRRVLSTNRAFLELVGLREEDILGAVHPYPGGPKASDPPPRRPAVPAHLPARGRLARPGRDRPARPARRQRLRLRLHRRGHRGPGQRGASSSSSSRAAARGDRRAGRRRRARDQQPALRDPRPRRVLLKDAEPGSKAHTRLRADPANRARDQGDRARSARLRPRECRGTAHRAARGRGSVDGRPRAPHQRAQGRRDRGQLRRVVRADHRQPEPAQADLPQPDRQRAPGDAERRLRHDRRAAGGRLHVRDRLATTDRGSSPACSTGSSSRSSRPSARPAAPASVSRSASGSRRPTAERSPSPPSPAGAPSSCAAARSSPRKPTRRCPMSRVLVIDDEDVVRMLVMEILDSAGHTRHRRRERGARPRAPREQRIRPRRQRRDHAGAVRPRAARVGPREPRLAAGRARHRRRHLRHAQPGADARRSRPRHEAVRARGAAGGRRRRARPCGPIA